MGFYAVKYIPTKYIVLNLPQVYILGHWNCLHLLVRGVVNPNHAEDLDLLDLGDSKPLDDTDLDIEQANPFL
jgi:hypothetical protein